MKKFSIKQFQIIQFQLEKTFNYMKIFLKNFFKQNNNITLTFNLKTLECKIIYAAKELFDYTNTDFYELFPNQIKEQLIKIFFNIVLNSKENRKAKNYYKNIKQKRNKYIEPTLLIKTNIDNFSYYRKLSLKLALLFNDFMSERVLLYGSFYINENIVVTIHNKNSKEKNNRIWKSRYYEYSVSVQIKFY